MQAPNANLQQNSALLDQQLNQHQKQYQLQQIQLQQKRLQKQKKLAMQHVSDRDYQNNLKIHQMKRIA